MSEERIQDGKIGSAPPDFCLVANTGEKVGLEDYRGKVNVVLFFVREYG